ncbi:MAG: hypothetical protein HY598_05325 [Candidatus Omnitrophica bacterium]|nr:hypothetical protein [Candidatus Omnitrophota bacterium]
MNGDTCSKRAYQRLPRYALQLVPLLYQLPRPVGCLVTMERWRAMVREARRLAGATT